LVEQVVLYERRSTYALITINRPDRRNALNAAVGQGIIDAINAAEADASCRSIVLTGAGASAFCAGGDLQPDRNGTPFQVNFANPRNFIVDLLRRMIECRLPIVARVNGHALAGGFGLCCACDIAISTEGALFGVPEARIGIFPMMILPHMLRLIPQRALAEMCLTGEPVSAAKALEWGILNYVVPAAQLDEKVDWIADRIARCSPTGVRIGKIALSAMRDMSIEQSLEYAQVMLQSMSSTPDANEGFRSFQEKRRPNWVNQA
jgi:enoyl-CoA hydratase/carnithine racemase